MSRESKLREAFEILRAATADAAACVQNNCADNMLLLQLIDSQKRVQQAYNDAWKIIVNLPAE